MNDAIQQVAPAALPLRDGLITIGTLIDLYMAHYAGRDTTRRPRLAWWASRIGPMALQDLSDDHVHSALEDLAGRTGRFYAGRDADGAPIFKARRKPMSPATVNRYAASLSAVVTWAVRRRIAPKGFVHPCRSVERRPESSGRTRFLSDDERRRLLDACRASRWPRLYLLTLAALTTGARKGELLGLRWRDVDLDRGCASVTRTKNGDARVLVLVPAVVQELRKFQDDPPALVFPAKRAGDDRAYSADAPFREALRVAKVKDFRFHDLRHSCASMLAQSGATLLQVAEVLGHKQIQMTKRYSHLATGHKAELVNRVMEGVQ